MCGSEVTEALQKKQGDRLTRDIRHWWAISNAWGDLQNTWVLRLPAGKQLNAYWGLAKFQPRDSIKATKGKPNPRTKTYEGGSIQLVLSIGPEERKYISGPFKTIGLSFSEIAAV